MFAPPEHDPEEATRIRRALADGDRVLVERLFAATRTGSYERAFLTRDPVTFNDGDRRLLKRLAWHYRLQLPRWLRPTTNPDDPIVRENEMHNG